MLLIIIYVIYTIMLYIQFTKIKQKIIYYDIYSCIMCDIK